MSAASHLPAGAQGGQSPSRALVPLRRDDAPARREDPRRQNLHRQRALPVKAVFFVAGLAFGHDRRTIARRSLFAFLGFLIVYFGVVGSITTRIDANPAFMPPAAVEGGSHAIDMAIGLVDREVNQHRWLPNDPWFMPVGLRDNAQNFQLGVIHAIGRFSFELVDHIGRARGSSRADPDLERAAGFLQFPVDIWHIAFEKSLMPTVTSDQQYRAALRALTSYNTRLAQGQAIFERRGDALAPTLTRIAADLGSQTALLEVHSRNSRFWLFDFDADDIFFRNKGITYAYYLLLRELGRDFEAQIAQRGLNLVWEQTVATLRYASQLDPLVVMNARSDGVFANHLVLQGFYINRAVIQLEELVKTLNF
jgi:hypothetical protein